jgi:hypothetical protein
MLAVVALAMNRGSRKKIPIPATRVMTSVRMIEPLPSSTPSSSACRPALG